MLLRKKNFFIIVFLLLIQSTSNAKFWNWFQDPADPEAAKRIAEQQLDYELQPHNQSAEVKEAIQKIKSKKLEIIKQMIAFKYLSKSEAKSEAEQAAHDEAIDLALNIMNERITFALKQALAKHGKLISDEDLKKIYSKVNTEVIQKMKWASRPATVLQEYTKPDYHNQIKIDTLVNQEVTKAYPVFAEKYFSANDIVEIYPENKISQIAVKKERGQLYREKECTICMESFNTLGKRINLECGHASFCMKCTIAMLYIEKRHECPLCRAQIDLHDFSLRYLKSNMKEYDHKIIEKLDPNLMKKIRDLFNRI